MFQNAFKRRRDKQADPSSSGGEGDASPSTSPKEPDVGRPSQSQPPAPVAGASNPTRRDTTDSDISLVQDPRETGTGTPPGQDEEALRMSLDHQPQTTTSGSGAQANATGAGHSSESTVVQGHEASSTEPEDVFDSTSGVRKSQLVALAAEVEAMQRERGALKDRTDGMSKQVEQAEARERGAKEEVDRSLRKIELLEGMLSDERRKNVALAEGGERALIASLQDQLQREKEKSKTVERELKDASLMYELVKTEWMKKLELAMGKLALSEKKARELGVESHLRGEQVETLEKALRAERVKARTQEEDFQTRIAAAHAQVQQSPNLLQLSAANSRLTQELAEVRREKEELASRCEQEARSKVQVEEKLKKLEDERAQLVADRNFLLVMVLCTGVFIFLLGVSFKQES